MCLFTEQRGRQPQSASEEESLLTECGGRLAGEPPTNGAATWFFYSVFSGVKPQTGGAAAWFFHSVLGEVALETAVLP